MPDKSTMYTRRTRSPLRVFGVLALGAGVLLGGYVGYSMVLEPGIIGGQQEQAAQQTLAQLRTEIGTAATEIKPANDLTLPNTVPTTREPKTNAASLGVLRVPRFGKTWVRTIRQGVGEDVLNSFTAGVGHYPGTAMPGGTGNFAIAAHDTGYGNAFLDVPKLRRGDLIYVTTRTGTYTYRFDNLRTVTPTSTEVILPVPGKPHAIARERLITLTTCWPPYNAQVRLAASGVLVGFTPAD